jgi:pimeloyl-ACP methyl ester carboxylesterase
VQTPLLVIAGKHDFPGMRLADLQASMNGAFPRVEWVELAEAGHYPMDESPMALAQALDAFLKRAQTGEK